MSSDGTITGWLERLKAGDSGAAALIWERYFSELVRLARRRLDPAARRAADEEDVALSALDSFYRGVARGRFPDLADRENLWRILVVITARKASDLRLHERRQKRGGGQVPATDGPGSDELVLDALLSEAPSPELLAEMMQACEQLFERLDAPLLREIALARMEGLTTEEIAEQLGCVPRTVERKLALIRLKWTRGPGDG